MGNLVSITTIINILVPFFFLFIDAEAQSPGSYNYDNMENGFRPSLAVVIGILSIMFSLTFLLLVYAKFCHRPLPSDLIVGGADQGRFGNRGILRSSSSSRFSGIDKTVIESLPYFRFSTLEGAREGLECAVCLSKFEDIEILRLLPKCKHAFHIDCVDRWLENHSSCPLCRHRVDPSDITIFTTSNSLRISRNPSDLTDDHNIELFVRREQDPDNNQVGSSSSRFSIGSSFRRIEKGQKGEELPIQEEKPVINGEYGGDNDADDRNLLVKFNRSIIVSDVVFKNRWSDVNSSDLSQLNSEMLRVMSSRGFSPLASSSERFSTPVTALSDNGSSSNERILKIKEEIERKKVFENKLNKIKTNYSFSSNSNFPSTSGSESNPRVPPGLLVPSEARSVSEINLSRFPDYRVKNRIRESLNHNGKDERLRKVWIPIARRTVQWFAGRENRSQQQQQHQSHPQHTSNV
ncbi:E3 ubiquitin-protein ligase ATL42 [Telopea speciosissima]|uniref:E3 ubiquitin-protein ligase ATL42 n=1 Tax=Telopea speciosissima TaxID=54955 RepID=UPI001CC7E028|nr:E3 ubiquitin-protein ligase ATL42 [Telopea speciosissima]